MLPLRRDSVGRGETAFFRSVNRLPDDLFPPAWTVMQLGTIAAVPVAAAAATAAHRRRLGARLLVSGTAAWALSKVAKRHIRRGRPAALLADAHVRGRDATGLGYFSGHSAVAAALGVAALPHLPLRGRSAVLAITPLVGLSRIYVGAHLPLDVAGGAGVGIALEALVALAQDRWF
jgi:membrane-associated phospholipid phosphatase